MGDRLRASSGPAWAEVHRRMHGELDALTDRVVARLRAELPGYASLPVEAVRPTLRAYLHWAIPLLFADGVPTEEQLRTARSAAALRAEQGVPVEDVLRAWRITSAELWHREQEVAAEVGVHVTEQLAAAREALVGLDPWLHVAAQGHRAGWDRREGRDVAQRGRLLRGLLLGTSSAADLDLLASGYHLTADGLYRAVRALGNGEVGAREAERALRGTGPALVAWIEDELLAVLPADATVPDVRAGVGGPATLAELPRSFAEAAAALETATAFGRVGPTTLDELGAEVAVATRPDLGARLAARFVAPLLTGGAAGADVLCTVDEHLRCGLRVHRTAQSLFVHPNTVRHRLRRFEDATGARLDDISDVVAVWWALRHHEVHSG